MQGDTKGVKVYLDCIKVVKGAGYDKKNKLRVSGMSAGSIQMRYIELEGCKARSRVGRHRGPLGAPE